jgi:hypothetical protein
VDEGLFVAAFCRHQFEVSMVTPFPTPDPVAKRPPRLPISLTGRSRCRLPLAASRTGVNSRRPETPSPSTSKSLRGLQHPGFILESVEGGIRIARYSFIGTGFVSTITLRDGVISEDTGSEVLTSAYTDPLDAVTSIVVPLSVPTGTRPVHVHRRCGGVSGLRCDPAVRARVGLASGAGWAIRSAVSTVGCDGLFDHLERTMKVVAHVILAPGGDLRAAYDAAERRIDELKPLGRPVPCTTSIRPTATGLWWTASAQYLARPLS